MRLIENRSSQTKTKLLTMQENQIIAIWVTQVGLTCMHTDRRTHAASAGLHSCAVALWGCSALRRKSLEKGFGGGCGAGEETLSLHPAVLPSFVPRAWSCYQDTNKPENDFLYGGFREEEVAFSQRLPLSHGRVSDSTTLYFHIHTVFGFYCSAVTS